VNKSGLAYTVTPGASHIDPKLKQAPTMTPSQPTRIPFLRLTFIAAALLAPPAAVLLADRRPGRPAAPRPDTPPAQATAAEPPADPLLALNDSFRAAYRNGRAETLAHAGPVVLVEGDDLVLLHDGRRSQVACIPAAYHTLKAVTHVPLALYVLLEPFGDGTLSEERLAELRRYRELVVAGRDSLEGRGFSAPVLQRQERILAESLAFLDGVLSRRRAGRDEVAEFARRLGPLLLANADEAARLELDALHAQTAAWRRELTADEWRRLHVVVMGSAMPRRGNLAVQYYARLLGEPGEGARIIYAESLWDEGKARDLLGTHLLDTAIGADFFGDGRRMHRDLLADAAEEYLKKLLPGP
jgi:hypothetical protein